MNFSLKQGNKIEYYVMTGTIDLKKNNQILLVTIIKQKLPANLSLKKRGITKLDVIHVVNYATVSSKQSTNKQKSADVQKAAVDLWTKVLQENKNNLNLLINENADSLIAINPFKSQHTKVWKNLWNTGFQISTSLADDVLNGDQINATIYAVLSQVRSFEFESSTTEQFRTEISRSLFYAEGCYDDYHTLQVRN